MFIPQTHKVRHKILKFLADKRNEQLIKKLPIKEAQFTVDEIANAIKVDRDLVDEQLHVLWKKFVIEVNEEENSLSKFLINAEGIALASSRQIINDGKIINSQLFNNYASGIFQILVGLIALYTIYANLTTIERLEGQLEKVEWQMEQTQSDIRRLEGNIETQLNSSTKTLESDSIIQENDTLKQEDKLKRAPTQ